MAEIPFTEDEKRIALSISGRPDLICLDVVRLHTRGLWLDAPETESEEYDDTTCRADVDFIFLCTEQQRKMLRMNFFRRPALRLFSSSVNILPTANMAVIDVFPITESVVKIAIARFLKADRYYNDGHRQFLFNSEVCDIDELSEG